MQTLGPSRWTLVGSALALAGMLTTRASSADDARDEQEPAAAWVRHPVTVYSEEPGLSYQLRDAQTGQLMLVCSQPCQTAVPAGRYRVIVEGPDDTPRERVVRIEGASEIGVSGTSGQSRSAGLILGIAGAASAAVGMVLVMPTLVASSMCHGECREDSSVPRAGLALLLAGGIATPVGWSLFARNHRPRVEVRPMLPRTAKRRAAPRVAIVPMPGRELRELGVATVVTF